MLASLRRPPAQPVPGDLRGMLLALADPQTAGPHADGAAIDAPVRCCRPIPVAPVRVVDRGAPAMHRPLAGRRSSPGSPPEPRLRPRLEPGRDRRRLTSASPDDSPARAAGPPAQPRLRHRRVHGPGPRRHPVQRPLSAPAVGTRAVVRHNRLHERRARPGRPRPAGVRRPRPASSRAARPQSGRPRPTTCPAEPVWDPGRRRRRAARLTTPSRSTCRTRPGDPPGRRPPQPHHARSPDRSGPAEPDRLAQRRPPHLGRRADRRHGPTGVAPASPPASHRHTRSGQPAAPASAAGRGLGPDHEPHRRRRVCRPAGAVGRHQPAAATAPQQKGPGWGALVAVAAVAALVAATLGGMFGGWLGATDRVDFGCARPHALLDPPAGAGATARPEGSIANIAAKALPSVVTIKVDGADGAGTGSGFVLDRDGHIITNNHVVASAADGRHHQGRAVQRHRDRRHDRRPRRVLRPRRAQDRPHRPRAAGDGRRPRTSSWATRSSPSVRRSASSPASPAASSARSTARSAPAATATSSPSSTPSRPTRRSTPATAAARCSTCRARSSA